MRFFRQNSVTTFLLAFFVSLSMLSQGRTATTKVEDIIAQVAEKANVQQKKVNDFACDMLSTKVEKDSTGKVGSTTQHEMKSYFKKPDKQVKIFIKGIKDGKPVLEKDLQPSMFLAPILKPSEELAEQIQKEMKSILSPSLRDKFDFKLLREEKLAEDTVWVIEAVSRSKDLKLKKATLWISKAQLRTVKIEAESIETPTSFLRFIKITSFLSEVQPNIFLPKINKIAFGLRKVSSKDIETTNEFSHYQINAGLEDSLFQKKQLP